MKTVTRKNMLYEELIANTENIYMIKYLEHRRDGVLYLYDDEINALDWNEVIRFILDDGHDMTGFGLWEIPIAGVYIFINRLKNEEFFIETKLYDEEDESPIPSYYKTEEEGTFHYVASSIKEAIELNENTRSLSPGVYVGIKYKDGDLIYEGDIVHHGDPNITYTVIWMKEWGRFGTKQNGSRCLQDIKPWQPAMVKVGSVHENDNA